MFGLTVYASLTQDHKSSSVTKSVGSEFSKSDLTRPASAANAGFTAAKNGNAVVAVASLVMKLRRELLSMSFEFWISVNCQRLTVDRIYFKL
jgi:hypothetical protein